MYKDECVVSFDTPESEGGLYVCLRSWNGVSKGFAEQHSRLTSQPVYLHIKKTRCAGRVSGLLRCNTAAMFCEGGVGMVVRRGKRKRH